MLKCFNREFRIVLMSSVLAVQASLLAQSHRDVQVASDSGRLVTGVIDFEAPGSPVELGVRLFASAFGEAPNGTDDPGFNAASGAFPQGTLIGFDILDALRKWDGADFDAIPSERLFIGLGASNRQTPVTASTLVSGFNIVQAGSGGGFHQHINYFLLAPASSGVYLLTLQLRAAGYTASEPIYIVFGQNALQADRDAAWAYVRDVLLAAPVCSGDANGDRIVNFSDITAALSNFGSTGSPGLLGDADRSGVVNFGDITTILSNFGGQCP